MVEQQEFGCVHSYFVYISQMLCGINFVPWLNSLADNNYSDNDVKYKQIFFTKIYFVCNVKFMHVKHHVHILVIVILSNTAITTIIFTANR